ncbi:T-cell surface glycoprotein CD3 epsilon chain-like [Thalassophryne amazonica]|uniref:T-cell surface glycoprotein CD3 epsilon chain-like n=1 Tax=Thalassophryne amazonica TaxID=390379 RepID=UPI001471410B|nr:T-cell surface glycoprotein CD3 epsilon chain-like [Thalassophryne amazonica]
MTVQVLSAVVLLLAVTVEAKVSISGTAVTMTCPDDGDWFNRGSKIPNKEANWLTIIYDDVNKDPYHCEYGEDSSKKKYYFYVQGKVCETCYELDGILFAVVIIADMIGTAVVMFIIYKCTKNKSSGGSTHSAKTPPHAAGRGPPVPSPDYEQLSTHTRSHEPYSTVHRMG